MRREERQQALYAPAELVVAEGVTRRKAGSSCGMRGLAASSLRVRRELGSGTLTPRLKLEE